MYSPKSSSVAGLLGIFLGAFGVHDWYLGNRKKSAKAHVALAVVSIICFAAATIIRTIISSGQTPTIVTLLNNIATIFSTVAWLTMLGDIIWGAIEGVVILAQGDAGLTARGYFVKGDPNNPLSKALSSSTVRQLDNSAVAETNTTAAITPHVPVVLPDAPTLEQQGSNASPSQAPIVFRSSDIRSDSTFDHTNQPAATAPAAPSMPATPPTPPQANTNIAQNLPQSTPQAAVAAPSATRGSNYSYGVTLQPTGSPASNISPITATPNTIPAVVPNAIPVSNVTPTTTSNAPTTVPVTPVPTAVPISNNNPAVSMAAPVVNTSVPGYMPTNVATPSAPGYAPNNGTQAMLGSVSISTTTPSSQSANLSAAAGTTNYPANVAPAQPANNIYAQPTPYPRPLPKPTTAIGTKTISKTKTSRPKVKLDFRSPAFIKLAISIAIAVVIVIAGLVVKWVFDSAVSSGYGETYLAAKELSTKLNSLSQAESCNYVVNRVNVVTVDNVTYESYITNCQELLTSLPPLIDRLGQTPAIGWNENIAADFEDFKTVYDDNFPNAEQAAATTDTLEVYRAWHAYLVDADLLTVDSPDEDFQRAAEILISSNNETLSNYGQEWLTRELEYINAYRTYSQAAFDDPAKAALREDMELKRVNLENWVADHRPDLETIAPISTPDLTQLTTSYARLYERIKRGYAQHYDPKIGGCDNSTGTVICQ